MFSERLRSPFAAWRISDGVNVAAATHFHGIGKSFFVSRPEKKIHAIALKRWPIAARIRLLKFYRWSWISP
jgi:hypothetical protein